MKKLILVGFMALCFTGCAEINVDEWGNPIC